MDFILANIPFYNKYHREKFIADKLNILKLKYPVIKDLYGDEMHWDVVKYYLLLAYDNKFYEIPCGPGLRIHPYAILNSAIINTNEH